MDKRKRLILYMHAGSGNHGCEAIVASTMELIDRLSGGNGLCSEKSGDNSNIADVMIITNDAAEDRRYFLGELEKLGRCRIVEERHIDRHKLTHVIYYIYRKITKDAESFYRYRYKDALNTLTDDCENIAISIGGDNYCYPEMIKDLRLSHNVFMEKNMKTFLMGCSVEPDSVAELKDDLEAYDHIIARETITYDGLIKGGIDTDKVSLCPDPAFALPVGDAILPDIFSKGEVIGLNVSPMVQGKESSAGITMENYRQLIRYILNNTNYGVALIPHVIWNRNDDFEPLMQLYNEFSSDRVALIDDMPASNLKGIISKCKLFVGARTHSTIAAYSTCVPTLVIGYSVKSRGIARDIFGTEENYVIPVQSLKEKDDLLKGFKWIEDHETEIRQRLQDVMPDYKKKADENVSLFI